MDTKITPRALASELLGAARDVAIPFLEEGVADLDVVVAQQLSEIVAEIAITGETNLLDQLQEAWPIIRQQYRFKAGRATNEALFAGVRILAKGARAGLAVAAAALNPAGAIGSVLNALGVPADSTPEATD